MKLEDIKSVYCIGIKGSGVSAVAEFLSKKGIKVSGSDTGEVFYTDEILRRNNIYFFEDFDAAHVPDDVDVIIYSTAYNKENNIEVAEAERKSLPMASYPEVLGMIFLSKLGISVCGTHGKTTTSAMLAQTLKDAGVQPDAIIGSQVRSWHGSSLTGNGEYIVAESDEYQNKLRYYNPWSVVLTSVDWDHPDFFPNFESYKKVFHEFVEKIPKNGHLVVWGDSSDTLDVSGHCNANVHTYGLTEENDFIIRNIKQKENTQSFELYFKEELLGFFETPLTGKHNVLNSSAVIVLCYVMNMDLEKVKKSISEFEGTSRRFEIVGKYQNSLIIDDYAHHPDEIKATLSGARQRFGEKNIWTVFHPHTFTRTKAFIEEFAQSFDDCDKVIIVDIYGSAREKQGGVSSKELVDLINKYNNRKAEYIPTMDQAAEYLKENSTDYDILITMGAGDVWKIKDKMGASNN